MERSIAGFHLDADGNWVAELDCGHDQHVYHRRPFQVRPWVIDTAERNARVGTPLDCPLCERDELGGEAPCFACLVCPECGGIMPDGHLSGCQA